MATESSPRCTECGGRLFLEGENRERRPYFYWSCLSCGRQFNLDGSKMSYRTGDRRIRVVQPTYVPVRV